MSLLYVVIVRGSNVTLVDYEAVTSNFPSLAKKLFDKLKKNIRQTYVYQQNYHFHYVNEDDFTYLCLSDHLFPKRTAFAFLEEIKRLFVEKYSDKDRRNAINYGMQSTFGEFLKAKMGYYNNDPDNDKIKRLQDNLQDVTTQMTENIGTLVSYTLDKILDREDQVQILVHKTHSMNQYAGTLKVTATAVRREQEMRALRTKLFIGGVVLSMILVIYIMY